MLWVQLFIVPKQEYHINTTGIASSIDSKNFEFQEFFAEKPSISL